MKMIRVEDNGSIWCCDWCLSKRSVMLGSVLSFMQMNYKTEHLVDNITFVTYACNCCDIEQIEKKVSTHYSLYLYIRTHIKA